MGFVPTDYSASEGDGSVTVVVELSSVVEADVVVDLITIAGTASCESCNEVM